MCVHCVYKLSVEMSLFLKVDSKYIKLKNNVLYSWPI